MKQANKANKGLHPNNRHNHGYDFAELAAAYPALNHYLAVNPYDQCTIDFSDACAVKALNSALLQHDYGIIDWDIPEGFLCPPIPGRVDYIHYIADLLGVNSPVLHSSPLSSSTHSSSRRLLDIGTGANGIYSLLAANVYGWHCTASDIDAAALNNVAHILQKNPSLSDRIELRLQHQKSQVFTGIIQADDYFDVSVCNPPFHASLEEALKGNQKKRNNLRNNRLVNNTAIDSADFPSNKKSHALNFGGQKAELWCKGGEQKFLRMMIKESVLFAKQCRWFTSLISKSDNVKPSIKLARKLGATDIKTINMEQGNKITRVLAWSFVSKEAR